MSNRHYFKILSAVLGAWMLLGGIAVAPSAAVAAESSWQLKKDEDGVRVEVRKVEGSSILEFKGTVMLDASLDAATRFFEVDGRIPDWFYQCSEARLIEAKSPLDKLLYFVISMPWPVQDRDLVFRRVHTIDPATGAVEYKTSSEPQGYPKQKGKTRMPYLKGLWRFTPLADGRTGMCYQQHSEVGGHIPDWLVNKLAVNIPFHSLSRFRELMLKEKAAKVL